MSTVKLVSVHKSAKAEIKAWTVKDSAEAGYPGEYPAGIDVYIHTKNHDYEVVIPMTEIERVYLDYLAAEAVEIGCVNCEPCGADGGYCTYCTFDGECPCRLGC